jgi:hypothetical protein
MNNTDKFDVFLCYNDRDRSEVLEIAERLKSLGINRWIDSLELRPGMPWSESLKETLDSIKSVAVFIGKGGDGPWQKQEIRSFLRKCTVSSIPVIPVILEDAPLSPDLPIFLMDRKRVDFHFNKHESLMELAYGITGRRNK